MACKDFPRTDHALRRSFASFSKITVDRPKGYNFSFPLFQKPFSPDIAAGTEVWPSGLRL
jgi:hypothetical protein